MERPKNSAYRSIEIDKISDKNTEQNESQKIYTSMTCMYSNAEVPRRYFGDILQLTNWILDSGATRHTTPNISDCIQESMVEIDKYIEFVDENFVTAK